MGNGKTHYEILGISPDANESEVRRAWHMIALENHPDKRPGDRTAAAIFKAGAEASLILLDEKKRAEYDAEHGILTRPRKTRAELEGIIKDAREAAHNAVDIGNIDGVVKYMRQIAWAQEDLNRMN